MRVLVVAEDAEVRATRSRDLERAGHEVCGASEAAAVTARVRATRPDALLLVAPASTSALRTLLRRARDAAEAALPAVVILDAASLWLRAGLPGDLAPAVALAATAGGASIGRAFATLATGDPRGRHGVIGGVALEYASRRLSGPAGEVWLTPSEAAVLPALLGEAEAFVAPGDLARALWGEPLEGRHARGAIRSYMHTLRGKLRAVGFAGAIESRTGVGYRLTGERLAG